MNILSVKSLAIPDIKVIRFSRFRDHRGFFTEPYRHSNLAENSNLSFFSKLHIVQANESFSKANVIRGLHFQWNPYMGKLVRTILGHMVDLFLDIRLNSPTFGKIGGYEMPYNNDTDYDEWIWVPPGFAHGNYFLTPTKIEYLCTGEYSQNNEAGISPLAKDIDWSFFDKKLRNQFQNLVKKAIITDKDREALSVEKWKLDRRSKNFIYGKV